MNEKAANSLIPQTFIQNIGDVEITSLRYEGEGPPLIFLHATGYMPWLWHPVARKLAGDYRIFAPYFCDHRNADPDNGGGDLENPRGGSRSLLRETPLEEAVYPALRSSSGRRRRTPDPGGTAPGRDLAHPGVLWGPVVRGKMCEEVQ